MGQTKRLLQRRVEHWRTAAAQWIGGADETDEAEQEAEQLVEAEEQPRRWIELKEQTYERCLQLAESQRTTVDAVVHQMIEQYWANRNSELVTPFSREQLDRNPLLQLDALSRRNFRPFGEPAYEAE